MTTQSVKSQSVNLFGSTTGNVSSKGKQNNGGFDLLMNHNMKTYQDHFNPVNKVGTKETNQTNDNEKIRTASAQVLSGPTKETEGSKDAVNKSGADKTYEAKQNLKSGKTTDSKSVENDLSEKDEELAGILGMLQSVQNAVMDLLKLSSEELNQMLSDQGLNIGDLLNPDTLKMLVLQNSGNVDNTVFLTDENLADTMKQLIDLVENIKNESGLSLSDNQIKEALELFQQKAGEEQDLEMMAATNDTEITGNSQKLEESKQQNQGLAEGEDKTSAKTGIEVMKSNQASDNKGQDDAQTGRDESSSDASKQYEAFLDNLTQNIRTTGVDYSGSTVRITEIREIANQIIENIKVIIKPEQTSMELQLNPEHLGRVNLTVQSKNGAMTAQFVVQNELAKEAIESQMHTLRETLNEQGIKVEAIEVTVSNYAFDQNSQSGDNEQQAKQKKGSVQKITLEEAIAMSELQEDQDLENDITGIQGSNINITA